MRRGEDKKKQDQTSVKQEKRSPSCTGEGHVGLSSAAPLCSPGVCCFFLNGETSLLVYKRLRHTASTFRLRLKSTRFFPEKQRPAGRMQPPRVEAVNKLPSSFCRVWKGATPFAIHLLNILNNEDKL